MAADFECKGTDVLQGLRKKYFAAEGGEIQ
jgi:hypothetical protein